MTETELIDALDRYGADLDAWPANDAAMARELLERSPYAKQLHNEAHALSDLVKAALPTAAPDVARMRRELLARIGGSSLINRVLAWLTNGTSGWSRTWRPAVLALVPLAFGFSLGLALPARDEPDAAMAEEVSLFAFQEATYEEYNDAE